MSLLVQLRDRVRWTDQSHTLGEAVIVGACHKVGDDGDLYDLLLPSREVLLYVPARQILEIIERRKPS